MAGEYRIGFSGDAQRLIERGFAAAPELTLRELRAFMARATIGLEDAAKERTPTDTGTLRGSVASAVTEIRDGLGVEGTVGTALNYAVPVELGAKPHWVPLEPLIDWVKRKGLAAVAPFPRGTPRRKRAKLAARREREVLRVARAIRFAIARRGTSQWQRERRGTPGAEMFLETFEAERGRLQREFEAVAQRIAAQIGGA